ncbi:MAG TPA: RagB/SusD family nutrient uptake outer membrane protein [Gemmatimonadaceae bacterium]|nr:RagB/SusD family nutrient uptake outer membrane protein [Gemmatimonadaceae bacterium]
MARSSKVYRMVGAAVLMSASACGDLEVTNPNNPDIARAVGSAEMAKSLAISTVNLWYLTSTAMRPYLDASTTADVHTTSFCCGRFSNLEPRIPYENHSAGGDREVAGLPWDFNYSTLGTANDVLRALSNGVALSTAAETAKYKQLAMFSQAASLMNLALWFDKAFVVDETLDLPGPRAQLQPYGAVSAAALAKWEALIASSAGNTAVYSQSEFPMVGGLTGSRLNRIANTMAAVTMAYTPRNATENAAVNWAKVAALAAQGIGSGSAGIPFDVTVTGDNNTWYSYINLYGNDHSWTRIDHRLINLMDGTTPPRFNGVVVGRRTSPDARYVMDFEFCSSGNPAPSTGDASCQASVIGDPGRGIYMQSTWYHSRYDHHARTTPGTAGRTAVPYLLAAENDLIRAEALIRSGGSRATAAALINSSRVTRGGLPAMMGGEATAALLAAIDYERQVELVNTNGLDLQRARQGLTARLQTGTWRHLPIPAKELETLGMPVYTFGGSGKEQ